MGDLIAMKNIKQRKPKLVAIADYLYRMGKRKNVDMSKALDYVLDDFIKRNDVKINDKIETK